MNSTGKLLRIFGAAILLIAVQFASVAAEAHLGHSHFSDGHGFQVHRLQTHADGAAAVAAAPPDQTSPASRIAPSDDRAQAAAQDVTAVQNTRGAAGGPNTCVTGCCGTGMGCCGVALVAASPSLPPKASRPRISFARRISIREADLRGLRKPPRPLA